MARVTLNQAGLRALLTQESQPIVNQIADRVQGSTAAAVGQIDGYGVDIDRYENVPQAGARGAGGRFVKSGKRYRVALVLKHPSAKGRKAANDAAVAALRVAGS